MLDLPENNVVETSVFVATTNAYRYDWGYKFDLLEASRRQDEQVPSTICEVIQNFLGL